MRSLPRETDEQMTSRVLGYASNTWWRFLDQPRAHDARGAVRIAAARRPGAGRHASQKASWFGTLRNVAVTPGTVNWLRQVWEKKETVTGLPLAEADYTALALELAVRQVDGWSEHPEDAAGAHRESRSQGRFQFVMPALSADPAEREKWFLSLRDVNNRRREPWVLEGLSYLHHPLRAEASKKYVQPSLEMLWEIQKTGDIFFPKRWLDATLGGHQTQGRGRHGARVPEEPAGELSGALAEHHAAVGGRAVSGRGDREEVGIRDQRIRGQTWRISVMRALVARALPSIASSSARNRIPA